MDWGEVEFHLASGRAKGIAARLFAMVGFSRVHSIFFAVSLCVEVSRVLIDSVTLNATYLWSDLLPKYQLL